MSLLQFVFIFDNSSLTAIYELLAGRCDVAGLLNELQTTSYWT